MAADDKAGNYGDEENVKLHDGCYGNQRVTDPSC